MDEPAIRAHALVKRYGDTAALDGFDLEVPAGTVCGLLGPNGAGKTTAVRILTTLLRADGGRATVAGADVIGAPHAVRARIGLSGQEPAVDEILSARQNLLLFGRLFGLSRSEAGLRADALLELMDLTDTGSKSIKHFSGGMRRRIDLAVTLIQAPPVLFLDEPTTGLDPRNRNEVWTAIRRLVAGGTTVLLTTQYLDEADQLADQIVVIDAGRSVAEGTPEQLKASVGGDRLEVVAEHPDQLDRIVEIVAAVAVGEPTVDRVGAGVTAVVRDRVAALTASVITLSEAGIEVADIGLRRPTLDDVFLTLTGHSAGAPVPATTDPAPDTSDPSEALLP